MSAPRIDCATGHDKLGCALGELYSSTLVYYLDYYKIKCHICAMLKTPDELRLELGRAIRVRRIGRGWSQEEAAKRAGMGISTWKRMETNGPSLVENMINAAFALRCEDGFSQLFPAPAAYNLDELLQRQAATVAKPRQRAPRRRSTS